MLDLTDGLAVAQLAVSCGIFWAVLFRPTRLVFLLRLPRRGRLIRWPQRHPAPELYRRPY